MTDSGNRDAAAVTLSAHAKINLSLHVVGKRDDGYHELESAIAFVDLADRVTEATARELEIQRRLKETEDFNEGVRAMSERRPGNFVGR